MNNPVVNEQIIHNHKEYLSFIEHERTKQISYLEKHLLFLDSVRESIHFVAE